MRLRAFAGVLLALLLGRGVQAGGGVQAQSPADPKLVHRPPPKPPGFTRQGQIGLDVAVSDAQGKPVAGLQPWEFQLTDQGRQAKILSFRGYDAAVARPEPPVELILVIDEVNLPFDQVAFVRTELTRFLRQNGGQLAQPTTLMRLTDSGVRVQQKPVLDGNALVKIVGLDQDRHRLPQPGDGWRRIDPALPDL
jgi:hypothetical protein